MDFDQDRGIDLHIHTTASDGTYTPAEILQMASRQGLRAIAITDHDTIDGARLALEGAMPEALDFLPGIEISTNAPMGYALKGGLHILGYGIDVHDAHLQAALHKLQQARNDRIPRIVERLTHLGIDIHIDQVLSEVGQGVAGRPHVASVLMKMGRVASIDEAFDHYLGHNRPAYVSKERLDCGLAFDLIHRAGGLPVLAHPGLIDFKPDRELGELLNSLCDRGLRGIEAFYPQHPPEAVNRYLALAQRFGLLVTGGTDFHGQVTPDIQMGRGGGQMHVPYALYAKLMAAL